MALHAEGLGFEAAGNEPGVKRRRLEAEGFLGEDHLVVPLLGVGADCATEAVGVTIGVFGGTEERDVGTELDGTLEIAGGEGVVDNEAAAGGFRGGGDFGNVDDFKQRVGRRLDPDEGWLLGIDLLEGFGVGEVEILDGDAELGKDLGEESEGASVDVLFGEDEVAGFQGGDDGGDGGDAAAEAGAELGAFQLGKGGVEVPEIRVAGPGVVEAAGIAVFESGREIDGRNDRAGVVHVVVPGVNCLGLEVLGRGIVSHADR